jgi:hypothetical protein
MPDARTQNIALQILDELRERNVEPTPINVLAATDMGLSSDEARDVADVIESRAKRRLADEYDAAQERGEVAGQGKPVNIPDGNIKATVEDLGLTRKDIHEARQIRDAEAAEPEHRAQDVADAIERQMTESTQ